MAINLLSELQIRNAASNLKEYTLKDGGGLFVLIHPNGSKYFFFRKTLNNKQNKIHIGVYPSTSLAHARRQSETYKQMIRDGINPSIEKIKDSLKGSLTFQSSFGEVVQEWLKLKSEHVSPVYFKKISGILNANCVPKIGKLPINEITTPNLLSVLKVIEQRNSLDLMERTRALLGEIFRYSISIGAFEGSNPVDALVRNVALKKHESKHYKTFKNVRDLSQFLRRLNEYDGTYETQLLIRLQMMIGTRPSEMRSATWDEFDLENGVWTIVQERMKNGFEHIIPLPNQAIDLIKYLKKFTGHTPFVFAGRTQVKSLSDGTANRALERLWPEYKIHPHGFRHLFSTLANENDPTQADIIEVALAHKVTGKIRSIYNSATYFQKRRALSQWYADFLDKIVSVDINEIPNLKHLEPNLDASY